QMLTQLQARQSALMAHQYLGLAEIQRTAGSGAGFDTLVVYENYPSDPSLAAKPGRPRGGELAIIGREGRQAAHYPLTLGIGPGKKQVRFGLEYRPDVFDRTAAEQVVARLVRVLEVVAADPGVLVGRVRVVEGDEWERVVCGWNATGVDVGVGSLVELF